MMIKKIYGVIIFTALQVALFTAIFVCFVTLDVALNQNQIQSHPLSQMGNLFAAEYTHNTQQRHNTDQRADLHKKTEQIGHL